MTIAALLAGVLTAGAAHPATIIERDMMRPEGSRHYLVMQPDGPAAKRPLVILLHGHGASAAMMLGLKAFAGLKMDEWARLAARENILLLAPDGARASDGKQAWNDCRADATKNTTTDDVGYIGALIDLAVARFGADPEQVYVFGSSHGGAMAFRLAIEMAPRLAAIGTQSAMMPARSRCAAPSHALSVFMTNGTLDPIEPYGGGAIGHWSTPGHGTGLGVEASAALWRSLAGLPEQPAVHRFAHLHENDKTSATRLLWGADAARPQVELLRIDGGGHTYPATGLELPWLLRALVGEANRDVDNADEAWAFFRTKRAAPAPK